MKRILLPFLLSFSSLCIHAQQHGLVAEGITSLREGGVVFQPRSLFTSVERSAVTDARWNQACSDASALVLDEQAITQVLAERPAYFSLELPSSEGPVMLDLEQVEITAPGFNVLQASTGNTAEYTGGAHYQGMVRGASGSLAAISIFPDEVMGLVNDGVEDLVLGRLADGTDGMHVFYREADLLIPHTASCGTVDEGTPYDPAVLAMEGAPKTVKCVRYYWEVNYDIFQGKGSVTNAANYVTGLFNQSNILYANDGISVLLSQVFVWDVPSPYTFTDTGDQLDQFGITRTSFNGDMAHLLGYTGGGGVAWLNTLCNGQTRLRMAYSDINSTYQNVPTYSWSVEVVTHEQGHNMGSRHTHACAWNGNNTAIDGCGPAAGYTEGTCAAGPVPSSTVGGTIMSYCHLTSATIKFANGFGPQPTAVIVNAINNANCLTNCAAACNAPTGLSAGSVTTSSALLTWAAATGAVTYNLQWKLSTSGTWTTVTDLTGTSHALSGLAASTAYNFQVMTVCNGGSSAYASPVTFTTSAAPCGVPTDLSAGSITSNSASISWGAVSGAVSYTVQWKLSTSGTWTTVTGIAGTSYAFTGLASGAAYNAQVLSVCSGSSSAYATAITFTTSAATCTDAYEPNGTQATSTQVVANVTLNALIGSGTDIDWFRFSNSSTQKNIRVRLTNLPANYQLRLYNNSTLKGSSSNTGTTSETIILNNAAISNNYRVRVIGSNSSNFNTTLCYTLSIEISATAFIMPEGSVEAADVLEEAPAVGLFPNPASDVVSVLLPAHEERATIEMLDALGHLVRTEQHGPAEAESLIEFSVADRTEGLYLVRVTLDGSTTVLRVVVAR